MVRSVCNFKRNALEMLRTPIANVIVKLNLKGRIGKGRGGLVRVCVCVCVCDYACIYLYIYGWIYEMHRREGENGKVRREKLYISFN